jgi:hypothetical protein
MLTAMPARSISVTKASEGETVRTPIWPRALVPAAPAIFPKQSESYTVSPSAAN